MKKSEGYLGISGEDEHCYVVCPCSPEYDNQFSINSAWVTRCPKCGRGFRTELAVYVYNPGEKDPEILDKDEWDAQMKSRSGLYERA